MITFRDLSFEIKKAEKECESTTDNTKLLKALVKLQTLQLKLLHSIRSNSVLLMKAQGISFQDKQNKDGE